MRGRRERTELGEASRASDDAPGRSTLTQRLQRRGAGTVQRSAEAAVDRAAGAGGAPLPAAVQTRLEAGAGTDLSDVRVHTGSASQEAAAQLGAQAYTTGNDIHFGAGRYQPDDPFGLHLLAHEVAHTVQQRGGGGGVQARLEVSDAGDSAEHEADRFADHVVHGGPAVQLGHAPAVVQRQVVDPPARARGDLRDPRVFPTYEEFAAAFQELGSFTARDTPGTATTGFEVLGDRAADDSSADEADHGVARAGTRAGEQHIDHPTRTWVSEHLPPELRMAVYELPADCADVAILLRHVWLFAHGRTETYGRWTIGVGAGRTESARAGHLTRLIRDHVYSGSVSAMVGSAYRDESGGTMRSFAALAPMLHAGDVLVWEHHDPTSGRRSGGHTQTIQSIDRGSDGTISSITLLQGNQPIFAPQADEIRADQAANGERQTDAGTLRDLPGRRIERGTLSGPDLQDVDGVWTWSDDEHTSLVAAGPPGGVTRPRMQRVNGERRRRASDWSPSLRAASEASLEGVWEAFLHELRAGLEGASAHADELRTEAPAVAEAAGARLASLRVSTARRRELGAQLQAMARSFGAHLNPAAGGGDAALFQDLATRLGTAAGLDATESDGSGTTGGHR